MGNGWATPAHGDQSSPAHGHVRHSGRASDDPEAVLTALADECTRVVTLTITGTGYRVDAHTGEFDVDPLAADLLADRLTAQQLGEDAVGDR